MANQNSKLEFPRHPKLSLRADRAIEVSRAIREQYRSYSRVHSMLDASCN